MKLLKFNENNLSIQDKVLKIVRGFNKSIELNTPLSEANLEFIDIVEISFIIEEEFDIEISDEVLETLKDKSITTSDIIKVVMELR